MADQRPRRGLYSREEVGAAIRFLRERLNLSRAQLARLAEVDRPYLGAYERGERWAMFPSYDKILAAMNVEWDEFGVVLRQVRERRLTPLNTDQRASK